MTNESSRRPSQAKAEQAIRGFLIEVGQDPNYYHLVEDGDDNSAPGKCGWAWWTLTTQHRMFMKTSQSNTTDHIITSIQ